MLYHLIDSQSRVVSFSKKAMGGWHRPPTRWWLIGSTAVSQMVFTEGSLQIYSCNFCTLTSIHICRYKPTHGPLCAKCQVVTGTFFDLLWACPEIQGYQVLTFSCPNLYCINNCYNSIHGMILWEIGFLNVLLYLFNKAFLWGGKWKKNVICVSCSNCQKIGNTVHSTCVRKLSTTIYSHSVKNTLHCLHIIIYSRFLLYL